MQKHLYICLDIFGATVTASVFKGENRDMRILHLQVHFLITGFVLSLSVDIFV